MTKAKQRLSGIELLRIIAMALVVVVHTDFWALGEPSEELLLCDVLKASAQYFIQAFAIVCVNCFIFISGWFSIKVSKRGFANLIFQIIFYNLLVYFAFCTLGIISFDVKQFVLHLNVFSHWFLASYVGLYLISPILNIFIDNAKKQIAKNTVIAFVLLDVVLGWGIDYLHFIGGYSLLHFMVIYIVARYINKYRGRAFELDKKYDALFYVVISIATALLLILSYYVVPSVWRHLGRLFTYNSPLVIISSVYLSLFFTKLKIKSKVVNFVGASSFAVYLIHTDYLISDGILMGFCQRLFENHSIYYYSVAMFVLVVGIFIIAVLVDQVRKLIWNRVMPFFS